MWWSTPFSVMPKTSTHYAITIWAPGWSPARVVLSSTVWLLNCTCHILIYIRHSTDTLAQLCSTEISRTPFSRASEIATNCACATTISALFVHISLKTILLKSKRTRWPHVLIYSRARNTEEVEEKAGGSANLIIDCQFFFRPLFSQSFGCRIRWKFRWYFSDDKTSY